MRRIRPALLFLCLQTLLLSGAHARTAPPAFEECEGDACREVAVAFDESRQQYRVHNNSTDRWVRVMASNRAASASACLAPGKDVYLTLKSIAGTYRADFAEARCGEHGPDGAPPGRWMI